MVGLVVLTLLTGCTNYLYKGSIRAEDNMGKERQVLLYWSKTDPLIGDAKADIAHVLTECGSLVVYENQPQGIVFRGEPQRDRPVAALAPDMDGAMHTFECGRILGAQRLTELGAGSVALTVHCEPLSNTFSVKKRSYLKASSEPYFFDVSVHKQWSLLGKAPVAPAPLPCSE